MSFNNPVLLVAVGLIVLVAIVGLIAHFYSPEAKLERRRRRSNYRVVSKTRRPMIKLSARTKKESRK